MAEDMKKGNQGEGQQEGQPAEAPTPEAADAFQEHAPKPPAKSGGAPEPPSDWRAEDQSEGSFIPGFDDANSSLEFSPTLKMACVGMGIFLGIFSFLILFLVGPQRGARLQAIRYCVIGMLIGFVIDLILLFSMGSSADVMNLYSSLGLTGGATSGGSSSGGSVF